MAHDGDFDIAIADEDGKVYVFAGTLPSALYTTADDEMVASIATTTDIKAIEFLADVDGDGDKDLLLGEPGSDEGYAYAFAAEDSIIGEIQIPYGAQSTKVMWVIDPNDDSSGDMFGGALGSIGDIGGGGGDEILIGSEAFNSGGNDVGRVYGVSLDGQVFTNESKYTEDLVNGNAYQGHPFSSLAMDYDQDGNQDLLVAVGMSQASDLYRYNTVGDTGIPQFQWRTSADVDPTLPTALRGPAAADYDNDGDVEVFIAHETDPQFLDWDGSDFLDASSVLQYASLADSSWSGAWGDFDRDGWIDLLVSRAAGSVNSSGEVTSLGAKESRLLKNTLGTSGTQFEDVTTESGLADTELPSMSASWADVDDDGAVDLLLNSASGSSSYKSLLYMNDEDGTFTEDTASRIGTHRYVSGATWTDLEGDEDLDLLIARIESGPSVTNLVALENDGSGDFTDESASWNSNVEDQVNSVVVEDFNLDGYPEPLTIPEGAANTVARLLRNDGAGFVDESNWVGIHAGESRGAAATDFNGDGDIDVFLGRPASGKKVFYENRPTLVLEDPNDNDVHWIAVELIGSEGNNRYGIGTAVTLTGSGVPTQRKVVDGGSGRGGQGSRILTFGLGSEEPEVTLAVTWPDGYTQSIVDPDLDTLVKVYDDHPLGIPAGLSVSKTGVPSGDVVWTLAWETNYAAPAYSDSVVVSQPGCSAFSETTLTMNNVDYYLVLQIPAYAERTGEGTGGGPGVGYSLDSGGVLGYVTSDGEDWLALHESVSLAVNPVVQGGKVAPSSDGQETGTIKYRTELQGASPNPFNPRTVLEYSLERKGHVTIAVYDLRGRMVRRLLSDTQDSGVHSVVWHGLDQRGQPVGSGVYMFRMSTHGIIQTRRATLLK